MLNLRSYLRHSSSTVQKAASYIEVNLRKKDLRIGPYRVEENTEVDEITQREYRLRSKEAVEHKHVRMGQERAWKGN